MLQSGSESNMELWILSRLAFAIDQCNVGFETYDFAVATTAIYNFWLYDLCDVYLVGILIFSDNHVNVIHVSICFNRTGMCETSVLQWH